MNLIIHQSLLFFCLFSFSCTGISIGETELYATPNGNGSNFSTSKFIHEQRIVRRQAQGGWCEIPQPPANGRYKPSGNRCPPGNTSPACQMTPGAFVPPNWVIYFSCDPGYRLNTTKTLAACVNGRWVPWLAGCEEVPVLRPCDRSATLVSGNNDMLSSCRGEVVFEDSFDGPLSDKWRHEIIIGDTPDDLFNVFRADAANSFISKGKLVIKPLVFDDNDVTGGTLDLEGCTAPPESKDWLCKRRGFPFSILPPVSSARIHTRDSFNFRYGVVQIRAKMPQGDWLVPELWLEPKDHFYGPGLQSGRVRIAMTRGNSDLRCEGEDLGLTQLESGVLLGSEDNVRRRTVRTRLPENWHREFHNYSIAWKRGSISFRIDEEQERELVFEGGRLCGSHDIAHIAENECAAWSKGSNIAPLDRDFYISIGLTTGNERDFPDDCINRGKPKPWRNLDITAKHQFWQARDSWRPTWSAEESSLYIDHIRVTAL